jgi:exopolyphosphatase/guanosine-5'-triphosphate,3'-diphosphate pyrophosphatase
VQALTCSATADRFSIDLHGDGDLSVEVYGGQAKGDLFASAFNRELLIRSVPVRTG